MQRLVRFASTTTFIVALCACSEDGGPAEATPDGSAGSGGADAGAHPKELPFEYTRPERGEPVSAAELESLTDQYLALLEHMRYFDFLEERTHGWPESDPAGRYWFGTWWSGVTVIKADGQVTYAHGESGADNNGLRTAPMMQSACAAYLLWGSAHEHLVRKLVRGHNAWILAMQRQLDDPAGTLLCRAFYPESVTSHDGERTIVIDYSLNRPGIDADPSEYVHLSDNPEWGDIWIKNKRSKDDIGHMLRAIAQLDSCQGLFSDSATEADLQDLFDSYSAWCRKVEDDDWTIATYDKSGQVWLPPDLLANFVDIANAECTSKLSIRLFGRRDPGDLSCGDGIGALDDVIMATTDHNGNIIRSFHEAAANHALLANRPETALSLLQGLSARIERGLDYFEGVGPEVPYLTHEAQVDLMVQAASVGVPLTWREVRWLHERIADADESFRNEANDLVYATFESDTPDGAYAFKPGGSGIKFRHLGTLLGTCTSQYRNSASKPLLDCDRLRAHPP